MTTSSHGKQRVARAIRTVRKHGVPMPRTAAAVAVSTVLLAVLATVAPAWLRLLAALLWVLVVPGLPWGLLMRLRDPFDTAVVVVATSMALTAIVAGGMALLGLWFPVLAVVILALQALAFTLLPATAAGALTRRRRRHRPSKPRRY